MKSTLVVLGAASLASAHFGLTYPAWRFDTLSDESDTRGYSQWTYPCAGVPAGNNRTDWPLTGGSLKLDLHHPWTYVFVNVGLGGNTTNFNITLTPEFLNVTGSGEFCLPRLDIPEGAVSEGTLGSLQVVTIGETGSALYNCADLRFTSSASTLPDNDCQTEAGITYFAVEQQDGNDSDSDSNTDGDDQDGAAAGLTVGTMTLTSMVGLAAAFAVGLF